MKILLYILFSCFAFSSIAQLITQQSQYLYNGLSINPAYAGSKEGLSISVGHTKLWTGFNGSPSNQFASIHTISKSRQHAFGVQANHTQQAIFSSIELSAAYAYHLKIKKDNFLSFGVNPGVQLNTANWDQLTLNDQNDEQFINSSPNSVRLNVGSGLYYYSPKYFVGVSAPSILINNQLRNSETNNLEIINNQNLFLNLGYIFKLNNKLTLKPSVLARTYNFNNLQADLNLMTFIYDKINLGVTYRTNGAVLGLIGFQPIKHFDVNYAYEYSLNSLQQYSTGSHHIIIRYDLVKTVSARNPRYF